MEIAGFEIKELIHKGKVSSVWKARQLSLGRFVAIKILNKEFAADPEVRSSFLQEAMVIARVKHENIVQVYEIADNDDLCYLSMEYADGPTLEQILSEKGRISNKLVFEISIQLARALECLWRDEKAVHRNIKPENVLTTKDRTVKLCDFGLLKSYSKESSPEDDDMVGTPNYMAPEAAGGRDVDFRSDMYSLGALIYQMLTGKAPFEDIEDPDLILESQRKDQISNPRDIVPEISIGAANLVTRMMMKSPDKRYRNWEEAIKDIVKASKGKLFIMNKKTMAFSTIADAQGAMPAGSEAKGRKAKAIGDKYKDDFFALPLWLHGFFWLAMISWWVYLAFVLMQEPLPRAERQTVPEETMNEAPEESTLDRLLHTGKEQAARLTDQETFISNMAQSLADEKYEEALQLVDMELANAKPENKNTFTIIKEIIQQISGTDIAVATRLSEHVAEPITIHHKGKDIRLIINAIINDQITAKSAVGKGKTISFSVSQLEPGEKARWLKDPESHAEHAMHFMLHFKAGDKEKAEEHAGSSGPMSKMFRRMLATD